MRVASARQMQEEREEANEAAGDELTTDEACTFVDELSTFHPLLILTGGEPLLRKDVDIVIEHAATSGVRTALATNGTLVNKKRAKRLRDAGLTAASISIDGADAQSHDSLRGVSGAYHDALNGAKALKEAGITFQINTTVTNANVTSLPRIYDMVRESGASAWHVFALVPTGRGRVTDLVSKSDYYEHSNGLMNVTGMGPSYTTNVRPAVPAKRET